MPELPDVTVFKQYLDRTALRKTVETVRVFDEYVIKEVTAGTLQRRLKHQELTASKRRGKHLFVDLGENRGWLGLHFGMTGYLKYFKDESDTPDYTRIRLAFTNDYFLAYVSKRKLGEVRIINDLDAFVEDHRLGPDAREVDLETFRERISGRRGSIKTALMNQKVLAGLGNVYTDEILFRARLHPETDVSNLDDESLKTLFSTMREVIEAAIDAKADPDEMPAGYLLPNRAEGADCPGCGGSIDKIEVGGRSTYYCPTCQKN